MSGPGTPAAARTLLRQLEQGWTVQLRHARGQHEFGGLSDAEDGNGKRHRIEVIETVDSVLVRARHADDGRAVVALWIHRHDRTSWTLDMAWRGRHGDELAPRKLTATQLKAYVAAPDPDGALAAVAALAPKDTSKTDPGKAAA